MDILMVVVGGIGVGVGVLAKHVFTKAIARQDSELEVISGFERLPQPTVQETTVAHSPKFQDSFNLKEMK